MRFKVQSSKFKVSAASPAGFSLLELIITLGVLAILVMGTIPLAQNAVKRQKELRLREALREMRSAIDEFKRDTVGACQGGVTVDPSGRGSAAGNPLGGQADPRSRVMIDDCKIFDTENLDRYPPSLEILVEGVKVKSRGMNIKPTEVFGESNSSNVFKNSDAEDKKKVYLREIPVDPITGEKDWKLRSNLQTKEEETWDEVNVFDVRSNSDAEAMNEEKYSDW